MKRFLEARRRSIVERPRIFQEYISALKKRLGDRASILVLGGRARVGIDAIEPRDYDVLIVARSGEDIEHLENLVHALRPRGLPVDIIVVKLDDLARPLVRKMLEHSLVLHDPLGVRMLLGSPDGVLRGDTGENRGGDGGCACEERQDTANESNAETQGCEACHRVERCSRG